MNFSSKAEWEQELSRLNKFFAQAEIPAPGDHHIDGAMVVHDLRKAIHTYTVRAEDNIGNPTFQGTLVGLQTIEQYLLKLSASK